MIKKLILCSFLFLSFEWNAVLAADSGKSDGVDNLFQGLDFSQNIEELPDEFVQWTLTGDNPRKEFQNVLLYWDILSPNSLFIPEIGFLSESETYELIKRHASKLKYKPDETLCPLAHTPVRFVDACSRRNDDEKGRSYYIQHWLWAFKQTSGYIPKDDYQFALTAEMKSKATCGDIESEKPPCSRKVWITEDQIKNITADFYSSPECGEILENEFRGLAFPGKAFTVESLNSYEAQIIQNARKIAPKIAQEKCGCYDILPCLLPLELCLSLEGKVEEIMVHHIFGKECVDSKSKAFLFSKVRPLIYKPKRNELQNGEEPKPDDGSKVVEAEFEDSN